MASLGLGEEGGKVKVVVRTGDDVDAVFLGKFLLCALGHAADYADQQWRALPGVADGGELAQVIESVTVLFPDEGVRTLNAGEMAFSYRHSLLTERPEAVVLRAAFRLQPGKPEEIRKKMDELMARRKASQPLEYPSAGSTFKRPEGYYAAALIDQCGLKGLTVGGAQVSEKHAGFVINRGSAACADVTALMAEIQRRVKAQTGVELEPEVRVIK